MSNFRILTSLLALLLFGNIALADIVCNGTSDDLNTALAFSTFLSATTGTYMVWYKPTGTPPVTGASCFQGEFIIGDQDTTGYTGIQRNANYTGGVDRLCVMNYDGNFDEVAVAYTNNAWTHLVWQHSGGNLLFYKDGALVSSTASGNTGDLSHVFRLCKPGSGATPYGQGVIGDALIFPTALSAAEIEVIGKSHLRRIASSAPSGSWELGSCGDGASCNTNTFLDQSGNARPLTAAGTTGAASAYLTYPWGVE